VAKSFLLFFLTTVAFAFAGQSAKLQFGSLRVVLPILHAPLREAKRINENTYLLVFPAPKAFNVAVWELEVRFIKDFDPSRTLKADMKLAGYDVPITKNEAKTGFFYSWDTPTKGSATYFYVSNPSNAQEAIRIGPFPSSLQQNTSLDWNRIEWK
jgi:hypothetical protein